MSARIPVFTIRTLVSAALLLMLAPPTFAYLPYMTDSGIPLRWWESEATFVVDDRLPPQLEEGPVLAALNAAEAQWNTTDCDITRLIFDGFGTCYGTTDNDENCIHWVASPGLWPGGANEVALTYVHFDTATGRIRDVDIAMNIYHHSFAAPGVCDQNMVDYDLNATMTHEFGHALGLDHTTKTLATMNGVTFPGDCLKRTLTIDDADGICASYATLIPSADAGPCAEVTDAGASDDLDPGQDAMGPAGDTAAPCPTPPADDCSGGGPGGLVPSAFALGFLWFRRRYGPGTSR